MNHELITELLATLTETRRRMYYLSFVLRCDLSATTRRGAESQMVIFREEVAELEYMLEAEYLDIDIAQTLLDIFAVK